LAATVIFNSQLFSPMALATIFLSAFLGGLHPEPTAIAPTTNDSTDASSFVWVEDPFASKLDSLLRIYIFPTNTNDDAPAFYELLDGDSAIIPTFPDSIYRARLMALDKNTPFELVFNPEVRRYIDVYTTKRREQVSRMLGLAEYYFPMFETALDAYDLPLELKYLAIVESALNPLAKSRVGATGLWQFMYWTGKMQGLEINSYVDERSDPIKSTQAACEYLSKLYEMFGDWNLALAAYNAGPGNVNKAIRRSGGKKTYWEVRPFLPKETGGYVPAFIAVNYVMRYAKEHQIAPIKPKFQYFDVDTVSIREKISMAQLSQFLDFDEDKLALLNPAFKMGVIPASQDNPAYLYLPVDKLGRFLSNEEAIYKRATAEMEVEMPTLVGVQEPVNTDKTIHRVKSGESLGKIAANYNVSINQIKAWNNLKSNTIYSGQRLTIHRSGGTKTAQTSSSSFKTYTVQPGDTLMGISRKHPGVSTEDLMQANNLSNGNLLKAGMKLKIPTS
jgi:membrane-bound lytic murein transglycosylase D